MTTLDLCRDQQAYHRDRADMATLENVRAISTRAALAWEREAARVEQREVSSEKRRIQAEAAFASNLAITSAEPKGTDACAPDERPFSENPDRGFAAP
jgi:hypothetical protein